MYFTFHRKSQPTGSILSAALQIQNGTDPAAADNRDVLIRWGSRINAYADEHFNVVLNNTRALNNASDKLESLCIMQEAGINTPEWNEDPEELLEQVGYPILGRDFQHSRGTDIKLILQKRDYRTPSEYYLQYIPTVREYRVHVVRDKVIRYQAKYLDFPEQSVSHIRNFETGYRLRKPRLKLRKERLEIAKLAVKSLGLDFGAVDLIIAENGLCYVLEVNTAPSCSPLTAKKYVNEFANILGIEESNINYETLQSLNENEQGDSENE